MKLLEYISIILLSMLPASSSAQPAMLTEHYGVEQGLPSNIVYCSLKDRDGFLWFGTWHGLCSFDGVRFTSHALRSRGSLQMPPRKVVSMVDDGCGHLWMRDVDNHLYVFDKRRESYHEVYEELKRLSENVQVIKIQPIGGGGVLLLTRNKNLYNARAVAGGEVTINLIYDAHGDISPSDMKLRHNVLGETRQYIYWVGMDYKIAAVGKGCGRLMLGGIGRDGRASCFRHDGCNVMIGMDDGAVCTLDTRCGRSRQYAPPKACGSVTGMARAGSVMYVSTRQSFYEMPVRGARRGDVVRHVCTEMAGATNGFVDKCGVLWMRKGHKLVCYDPATGHTCQFAYTASRPIEDLSFHDVGRNGLFIILRDGVTWHYDRYTHTMSGVNEFRQIKDDRAGQRFFDIDIDSGGTVWLSSTTNGVYKISFPSRAFTFVRPDLFGTNVDVPSDNRGVRSLYQSACGDIWMGTRAGDVYCMDQHYRVRRMYRGTIGNVYHIMEDSRGRLWFSTKGTGLVMAVHDAASPQGLKLTRYKADAKDRYAINSDKVYYTFQDSRGHIWVCTFGGGLNLIEERRGRVIFHNKDNDFIHYPKYDLYTNARSVVDDGRGRMWVGTTDGLVSFKSDFASMGGIQFETYREKDNHGIADNDIYSLYKDYKGGVWTGVFGGGLNKLTGYDARGHKPTFQSYETAGYVGGNVVSSIVGDRQHCLWLCTEKGIVSMAAGGAVPRSYDKYAGFPNVDIEDNTSVCLSNGIMLVGCRQGVLAFDPTEVRAHSKPRYNTFIVGFKVLNRDLQDFDPPIYDGAVRYARKITLNHDQSMFTIEYAALDYSDQNHISYKYILEGYEKQWHNNGNNRIASYANVPPGHYVFRVKVIDGSTGKEASGCSMQITVRPPWWASWWAYGVYTVLILALLYGVVRLILYMIKMRNEVYINDRLAELKIRFFTNVSHELRTPLTLIKSPIAELKKNETLSASGREYLSLIDKSAQQMLQLINQILDFRKIQNGKMQLHLSWTDVNELLDMFRHEFHMLADERDVAFSLDMPAEHVMAWCDAEKMSVVVRNLLSNAFKFTHKGGAVCVVLESGGDGTLCVIKVEDNGVGIPKSQMDVIFERFSQADNKKDGTSYTGTGIGLSLSKEFVNMHHGRIWAENSRVGRGATFIVEIPVGREHFNEDGTMTYIDDKTAAEKHEATPETRHEAEREHDSTTPVLVLVEDNADLCHMLRLQLGAMYNVYAANDGADGLRKIHQYHPDIIVTDLMMPGIDGMELLRRVRKDFSVSHIPVIVLTAKSSDDGMMSAITSGANAYITKPFNSEYLIARINQLLEEQRVFQRKIVLQGGAENAADVDKDTYEQHLVKKDLEFVHKIHELIEDNLNTTDFNIDTIAENVGLSRSAFFKKLKSLTGFAPVDLVKEIRLVKAAELIVNADDSIMGTAYSVGFRDSGYFAKCFRKKYGMTPKEYRNNKRGK